MQTKSLWALNSPHQQKLKKTSMNPSICVARGSISARKLETMAMKKTPGVLVKNPPEFLYMEGSPGNHASRSIRSFP